MSAIRLRLLFRYDAFSCYAIYTLLALRYTLFRSMFSLRFRRRRLFAAITLSCCLIDAVYAMPDAASRRHTLLLS